MTEEGKKESGAISRREFLKDAGLVVGGAAIGSTVLLAACGSDGETVTNTVTKTATTTIQGGTSTVTTTEQVGEVTKTETKTVSKFVCPYDNLEFDTLAELKAHIEAEHAGEAPAALNVVNLTVNGWTYEIQVEPTWSLQNVLHNKLGFISVKEMCTQHGACGSCTVIMDGRPILSCLTLAIECDGAQIETSEGIAAANHPLIEEYIMGNCMQCGYCTPGFVVTAKALLDKNQNPTQEDILIALSGNICRCATYPMHVPAIQQAALALKGGN